MILCEVVGNLVSTIKSDKLKKHKLLIVRPVNSLFVFEIEATNHDNFTCQKTNCLVAGGECAKYPFFGNMFSEQIAVDLVGAGEGDMVVVIHGSQINNIEEKVPSDCAIVGIVEKVNRKHE